ncbi:MAG TPA: Flp pilus assembly protein CpaB [Candidatus Binatia bacterium]|nr:Flp pilus assembly protein CpaB [Candidatus Binatia bacterium]
MAADAMRRPANALLLAVVLGALSAALVYRQLRAQQREAAAARTAAARPTVDVVVARETIPVGATVAPGLLRVVPWPADAQPDGAVHDPQAVAGGAARVTIERNTPVVPALLVPAGEGLLAARIAPGRRGMSVRVDDVTGVSGFITPGSRVDVLVAGSPETEQVQRSKVVLQNVEVLAIGRNVDPGDNGPAGAPTVTLLVSPDEAETLALASRYEPVRLALRGYHDHAVVATPGVSAPALFGAPAGAPAAVVRGGRAGHAVEVLLGGTATRQVVF